MRISHFLTFFILAILASCQTLPRLHPITIQEKSDLPAKCQSLFLESEQQLTHSIEATTPGGGKSLLMGILVISPESDLFESVIMTIEGLVVFSARYENGKITIERGISHFKSANFAIGLVNDIKLIFFKPKGMLAEMGKSDQGFPVCRYHETGNNLIELTLKTYYWEIRRYDGDRALKRTVRIFPNERNHPNEAGTAIPHKIQLTAHDFFGYSLTLRLLEAVTKEN